MKTKSTIQQIRRHSRQLVRELDIVKDVYQDSGLTLSQCHVMFELSEHGSQHLMDLANKLLLDKSNTSRTVKQLIDLGLVQGRKSTVDQRQKLFRLTARGKKSLQGTIQLADQQVRLALENLNDNQIGQVIQGMQLYATALRQGRLQADYSLRKIRKGDNPQVASLIREVMTEYGAVGEGYSIDDPEVDDMHSHYRDTRSSYYVIERDGEIVGAGGIGPLKGGGRSICELRKMFFRPSIRGLGLGRRLLLLLMEQARSLGYRQCYLETLKRMERANSLYRRNGFELLEKPLGRTGHGSCDRWYVLDLTK